MSTPNNTCFVIGGARSGKSRFAQELAESISDNRIFIATAEAHDDEMKARIDRHIADRGSAWSTIEAPIWLPNAIEAACVDASVERSVVLVDCLTLWLSNVLLAEKDVAAEVTKLAEVLGKINSPLVLVSNEVGSGIVPENELGRRFRDEQGRLNQVVAGICTRVDLVTAGLPIRLKG